MKAIRIEVIRASGSTPRDEGAVMWVMQDRIEGSIGGGNLEHSAILRAREILAGEEAQAMMDFQLGPETGQCCGGRVELKLEASDMKPLKRMKIAIFGAGHVAAKIKQMSAALPFNVSLYDTREAIELEEPAPYERVALPEAIIDALPEAAGVLIMTHDHALDFLIAERALRRDDLGFIGMIGSKSKAARFHLQYKELGEERLSRLVSPIAKEGNDKRAEAIALAILSEIFARF